jgi:phosphorylase kinase alpha/beta subunit
VDLEPLLAELERRGTLAMRPLASGLFPAAAGGPDAAESGYDRVWVRDNVFVAYAHHVSGRSAVASRVARTILGFYWAHRGRFEAIVAGDADPDDVMQRPHVRFDGATLRELPSQRWPHAQNDALGYALWLYTTLAGAGIAQLDDEVIRTLALFPRYFAAIRYWVDEDSGHWEEARHRSAASIGVVVAALERLVALGRGRHREFHAAGFTTHLVDQAAELARIGRLELDTILPGECAQMSPRQNRRYDAALLFLVHPLGVVTSQVADLILSDIDQFLLGDHGVRRYLGDSYWAPDYDEHLAAGDRTRDYSDDLQSRDALLDQIGHEAQWCLFDPILSACYATRYRDSGSVSDRERQQYHLRRALAQITPQWHCPELYYLRRGEWAVNPHTPLRWTQANLVVALAASWEQVRPTPFRLAAT